ncbi:phosphoenolpyruvate carboxylase [Flavobacterium aurantiibacter]|uniref:Phosphoenolpyruvate carboxylase n=1 Tax=Flavobacterium aurantiibacter TaxID=2023067 RepID=A0A256A1J7_9FLAO|nr:phosphoenolpyruvate carboxylase [Flavobacterium aurantiibacter]OYQ46930.1 phosphoenolpyruvate carboxylase [Flavobacterium aurantiibacter]
MYHNSPLQTFQKRVKARYDLYNSLFITLPFDAIDNTGALLPLFAESCSHGLENELSPKEIVSQFFQQYFPDKPESAQIDLLFRFIQYIERQIVLFDAVEDAGFAEVNNLNGPGTLAHLLENTDLKKLKKTAANFKTKIILTAHPTQFYPGSVLGIITDLTCALKKDDLFEIKSLLTQLGKTPFIRKEKPSPFNEATSLIWYLENVCYHSAAEITFDLERLQLIDHNVLGFGFWPGGDRDGNPFVTAQATFEVGMRLRTSILKCYYQDIRKLKRKLTFSGVTDLIADIEYRLYRTVFYNADPNFISYEYLVEKLQEISNLLVEKHQGIYLENIQLLLTKVRLFKFHFATLDVRQNSKIHRGLVEKLSHQNTDLNDIETDTLESVKTMIRLQELNGHDACHRYIISNCESDTDVLDVHQIIRHALRLSANEQAPIDIVPLFEVISDLSRAAAIMECLYTHAGYRTHLQARGNLQTVMLGFSDGTKDGGYLMANWSIYKAKLEITRMSEQYGIQVLFFDGRGGPPARGGGRTHQFYAGLGKEIANREIQITIQGQTVSSTFGTLDSCKFNLENLLSAGFRNTTDYRDTQVLSAADQELLDDLARVGHAKYDSFKNHELFVPYLEERSTLKYFSQLNIGSRPAKRKADTKLQLQDLRAIPFVGSWSQLKQNVPGFFGVGTALKHAKDSGKWQHVQELFSRSLFFKTLLENSMMSLAKSYFSLTKYMQNDAKYGAFWQLIYEEYLLSKSLLLELSDQQTLMENYPVGEASVQAREEIARPLLVIQQYAMMQVQATEQQLDAETFAKYEKLISRSLFGNTNASRNSA